MIISYQVTNIREFVKTCKNKKIQESSWLQETSDDSQLHVICMKQIVQNWKKWFELAF